jgi:hypothetical protein
MLIAFAFHTCHTDKFGFRDQDIITLTDDRAEVEAGTSSLPTRDHIVSIISLDIVYVWTDRWIRCGKFVDSSVVARITWITSFIVSHDATILAIDLIIYKRLGPCWST